MNLVNHQHLNLLTWRVSELSLCLIAGDSLGKSLGRTEHSNTCLRQRESRKKKKKSQKKKSNSLQQGKIKIQCFPSLCLESQLGAGMFCIRLSDSALQRQAAHLLLHTDKILSEEMLVPAQSKYLDRSGSGSQACPGNVIHRNAGKGWPRAAELLGCRSSKSAPQPAPAIPPCCPSSLHGRQGQGTARLGFLWKSSLPAGKLC